jgi:membrane fusion protein, multidrug efflux system
MPGVGETTTDAAAKRPKRSLIRRPLVLIATAAVLALGALFGVRRVIHSRTYQSTDDAFVDAHVVSVSPRVASYAARVLIDDNTYVTKGQLLVELDPQLAPSV